MKTSTMSLVVLIMGCGSSTGSSGGAGEGGSGGSGGTGAGGSVGPTERIVFVTASTQTANLGGLEGADSICAAEATSAGLDGEFRAWLSTVDTSAASRLNQASVPYVLVNGTRIAEDWDDLVDDELLEPIDLDAAGQVQTGDVWTGTLPSGQPYAEGDCVAFASEASNIRSLCGSTMFADGRWSEAQTPFCSTRLRLYCFQQ